ncbi:MAG: ABC transporter ATP-binding protein, partial [Acidobacteria bacterium]
MRTIVRAGATAAVRSGARAAAAVDRACASARSRTRDLGAEVRAGPDGLRRRPRSCAARTSVTRSEATNQGTARPDRASDDCRLTTDDCRLTYTQPVRPFRRLLPYLVRYRRAFLLGLACVVVNSTVTLLSPLVQKFAVDDLTQGVTRVKLFQYASLLVGIAVVAGYFRFLMRRILIGASRHIEYDLRNDFFAKLEQLPLAYYQARRTGDLMSRATNDLNAVRMMIGPAIMYSANTILTFVFAVAFMVRISTWLTLVALIPLP